MNGTTKGDPTTQDIAASVEDWQNGQVAPEHAAKKHFDTFETDFFQQGEDSSNPPVEGDEFDERDQTAKGRRPLLSRPSLMGLAITSTCVALLACPALWRSNAPASPPAMVFASSTVAPVAPIGPVASPPTEAVPPAPAAPAAPAAEMGGATPGPVANSAPVPAAEEAERAASPPVTAPNEQAVNAGGNTEPVPAAPLPNETRAAEVVAKVEAERTVSSPAPALETNARARCQQSIRRKRSKEILKVCPTAFAEDTTDADTAVALASVEFDRGRLAQAYAWSQKAIAANPASAEAYVFAGAVEQNRGHGKAAKEAYRHYLRLAPSGRHAVELRTIVNSL